MKNINGAKLVSLPITGLKHVRDLLYYDGPILSQYTHPNGEDYLYYWCDCDNTSNRWMILRVSEANILRLVNRFVPLDLVIPKGCRDDFVYIFDIAHDGAVDEVTLVPLAHIPEDYTPEPGAYLKVANARYSENSYSVLVEGGWSVRELGDFPKIFAKVYSVIYSLNVLRLPKFDTHPWRGGFSSMHFFDTAADRIPSEHRPIVSAMQYASPGFMRFSLHGKTADQVNQCIHDFNGNAVAHQAYYDLQVFIRTEKLNDISSPEDGRWLEHNDSLKEKALNLIGGFSVLDNSSFVNASPRPFETAKIAMAFYRYVRALAGFAQDGLVRFPRIDSDE